MIGWYYINLEIDTDCSDTQFLQERLERSNFGYNLSIAGLALQQDHLRNQSKEDRFLISGLKQTGRQAVGLAALKSAGLLIMSAMLGLVYQGASPPIIREVIVVSGPFREGPILPTLILIFDSPAIAKEVRFKLLGHGKASPALEQVFIEPWQTQATRVRIQILKAIRGRLASKDINSTVRRFDRSPSLMVTHGQSTKKYDFVQACVAFRSLLTPESLHYAYTSANRDFIERMAALFIVLTDGGQPITTFKVPTPNPTTERPVPSTSKATTGAPVLVAKPVFLLQSLASSSTRKRQNESEHVPTPTKRAAT